MSFVTLSLKARHIAYGSTCLNKKQGWSRDLAFGVPFPVPMGVENDL